MNITIPQKLTHGKELVIIPREEYEDLMNLKKIYEFKATQKQRKALKTARENRKKAQTLTLSELKTNLGLTN